MLSSRARRGVPWGRARGAVRLRDAAVCALCELRGGVLCRGYGSKRHVKEHAGRIRRVRFTRRGARATVFRSIVQCFGPGMERGFERTGTVGRRQRFGSHVSHPVGDGGDASCRGAVSVPDCMHTVREVLLSQICFDSDNSLFTKFAAVIWLMMSSLGLTNS